MKKLLTCVLCITLLGSCSILYVPTAVHTPLFKEKGQFSGTASLLVTFDASAAYSVSDNLFIHSNVSYIPSVDSSKVGSAGSIGIGYYKNIDNSVFEILGGVGYGKYDADFTKLYIQPSWAWRKPIGEFAFTLKSNALFYESFDNLGTPAMDVFVEPVGTFRFGKGKVMFQMQTGLSFKVLNQTDEGWMPIIANLGVHFRL